jgi:transposase
MRYSLAFKESLIKKVLPPESRSVRAVANEAGISEQSLHNWLNKSKEGTLSKGDSVGGMTRPPREKLRLLMESRGIEKEKLGLWLRENGLHSEHLTQYEQELRDMAEDRGNKEKLENKKLRDEIKRLQKDLRKKEKALAEMAALYTLKKKRTNSGGSTRKNDSRIRASSCGRFDHGGNQERSWFEKGL